MFATTPMNFAGHDCWREQDLLFLFLRDAPSAWEKSLNRSASPFLYQLGVHEVACPFSFDVIRLVVLEVPDNLLSVNRGGRHSRYPWIVDEQHLRDLCVNRTRVG